MEKFEKIEKVQIPDEDVPNWIKSLQKEGFSSEEMNLVLENLNLTYKKAKNPDFIKQELEKIKKYYKKKHNKILTLEEIEYFKKGIENKLED
ncbi:hypothetical protein KKG58_03575 [Patescibacteria group bacterium]|nr:hypothetical protein [Patescibacteria group bacterium]